MYWSDKVCCQHVRVVFHSWFNTRSQMLLSFLFLLHLFSVSACYQTVTIFMATLSPPQRHRGPGETPILCRWLRVSQQLTWSILTDTRLPQHTPAASSVNQDSGVWPQRRAWSSSWRPAGIWGRQEAAGVTPDGWGKRGDVTVTADTSDRMSEESEVK